MKFGDRGGERTGHFQEYWDSLEEAGPKMKELVLDRAANDSEISLFELRQLVSRAYPEQA